MTIPQTRRAWLAGTAVATAGAVPPTTRNAAAGGTQAPPDGPPQPDFLGKVPVPWIKRLFHPYSGPDGLTRIEQLPVAVPLGDAAAPLLSRKAARVTIGCSPPGYGWDSNVANYPTLLIPIFGSTIVTLYDNASCELVHGDVAIAQDCTGEGHISRDGVEGCLIVRVQLPRDLCPISGSSEMSRFWSE